jgi:hypothetical protein
VAPGHRRAHRRGDRRRLVLHQQGTRHGRDRLQDPARDRRRTSARAPQEVRRRSPHATSTCFCGADARTPHCHFGPDWAAVPGQPGRLARPPSALTRQARLSDGDSTVLRCSRDRERHCRHHRRDGDHDHAHRHCASTAFSARCAGTARGHPPLVFRTAAEPRRIETRSCMASAFPAVAHFAGREPAGCRRQHRYWCARGKSSVGTTYDRVPGV